VLPLANVAAILWHSQQQSGWTYLVHRLMLALTGGPNHRVVTVAAVLGVTTHRSRRLQMSRMPFLDLVMRITLVVIVAGVAEREVTPVTSATAAAVRWSFAPDMIRIWSRVATGYAMEERSSNDHQTHADVALAPKNAQSILLTLRLQQTPNRILALEVAAADPGTETADKPPGIELLLRLRYRYPHPLAE